MSTPPPTYLLLGSAASGRRAVLFNALKDAVGENANAVFVSGNERPSGFDAKLDSLRDTRLFRYGDVKNFSKETETEGGLGISRAFVVADSSIPPPDAVEGFKEAVDSGKAVLARIWGIFDCAAAAMFPRECADYAEMLSHFCDCVVFTHRNADSNGIFQKFSQRWRGECKPLLCVPADKNFNVPNSEELLVDEARRICMVFDGADSISDGDGFDDEPFSLEGEPDPYLERIPSGARAKPVGNISKYSLAARERNNREKI